MGNDTDRRQFITTALAVISAAALTATAPIAGSLRSKPRCFAKDGVCFIYDGDPASHQPTGTLRGHAEIVAALAVLNRFVREGKRCLFAERKLIIDWSDTRPSVA